MTIFCGFSARLMRLEKLCDLFQLFLSKPLESGDDHVESHTLRMTHGLWGDIYKYDYWSIIITELEQLLRSSSGQFTLLLPSSQMLSSFLHHWLETWLCLILANEGTNEGRGHHDTTCTVVENHKNVSFYNIASGASYVKSALLRMSAVCLHL